MRKVTLTNITMQTSGTYRCEVSTDGPKFEMVFKSANMNVLGNYFIHKVINITWLFYKYTMVSVSTSSYTPTRSTGSNPFMSWLNGGRVMLTKMVLYNECSWRIYWAIWPVMIGPHQRPNVDKKLQSATWGSSPWNEHSDHSAAVTRNWAEI